MYASPCVKTMNHPSSKYDRERKDKKKRVDKNIMENRSKSRESLKRSVDRFDFEYFVLFFYCLFSDRLALIR